MREIILGKVVDSFGTENNQETVWVMEDDNGITYEWWTKARRFLNIGTTYTFSASIIDERWNGKKNVKIISYLRKIKSMD